MGEVTSDLAKGNGVDGAHVHHMFAEAHDLDIEVFEDVIVCLPIVESKTAGGLIVAGVDDARQRVAKVVAAGPGRTMDNGVVMPNPVRVGDTVLHGKYASAGEPYRYKGKDYLLFKSRDLVGRLKT